MKTLDHTIALLVETRSSRQRNTQRTADFKIDGGGKLGALIRRKNQWNPKPCNPGEEKCSDTRFCSNRAQRSHLWPLSCPVNNVEKVDEAMTRRKRSHEIQINMRETSGRHRDGRNRGMNMSLDLAPLATETGTGPNTNVSGQSRPHKTS